MTLPASLTETATSSAAVVLPVRVSLNEAEVPSVTGDDPGAIDTTGSTAGRLVPDFGGSDVRHPVAGCVLESRIGVRRRRVGDRDRVIGSHRGRERQGRRAARHVHRVDRAAVSSHGHGECAVAGSDVSSSASSKVSTSAVPSTVALESTGASGADARTPHRRGGGPGERLAVDAERVGRPACPRGQGDDDVALLGRLHRHLPSLVLAFDQSTRPGDRRAGHLQQGVAYGPVAEPTRLRAEVQLEEECLRPVVVTGTSSNLALGPTSESRTTSGTSTVFVPSLTRTVTS